VKEVQKEGGGGSKRSKTKKKKKKVMNPEKGKIKTWESGGKVKVNGKGRRYKKMIR